MFPDISYLDWITGRPERAEFDLGSSDLRRASADSGGVVPPALADRTAPAETTVEAQLAEVYGVDSQNVLVTAGATHANFLAAAAALDAAESDAADEADDTDEVGPPDRVLVEKPGYEPLLATPEGLGATIDRFLRPAEDGYALDPERVAAASGEETVLITVTNRHNPSGNRVDRDTLAEVARVAADHDATLLVDEVYAPFGDEAGDGPFGGPTAAQLPNAVVTNSLTKFFGFDGARLGWLVADPEFVARARSVKHHVPAVGEPNRRLASRVLAHADELAATSRERLRTNREALAEFVAERDDLAGTVEPGCPYAFLAHESADGDAVAEAAWEAGVLVVPGRFFDESDRFRIAACRPPEEVRAGLDRLAEVLDGLSN